MNLDIQDKFGLEQNLLNTLKQNIHRTLLVCATMLRELKQKNVNISLTIVSDRTMQGVNKEWRGLYKTTNVLSLQNYTKEELIKTSLPEVALGDIFISWEKCQSEAQELPLPHEEYFIILFIHGFLHLLGYDHMKEEDEKQMQNLENAIVENLGFDEKGLIAGVL